MSEIVPQDTPQDKPNPTNTFIYALSDPRTNEIRYIGKSNDPQHRLKVHIRGSKALKTHKDRWINQLTLCDLEPILDIIEEVSIDEWQEREPYWIEYFRSQGAPLTNEAPGGMGIKSHTPEMRAKMSAKVREAYATTDLAKRLSEANKGKRLSDETKAKMSATTKGRKRPPFSDEWKENIRIGMKNVTPSPEARAKISKANKGRIKSPEECANISKAKKGVKRKPFTEEARRNMANASRGRKQSAESIAKSVASRKGRVVSEEARRNIGNASRGRIPSAEARAKMSAAQKRRNAMKKLPPPDAPTLWD
jgi:predicted GIY-YIG superfamily endonuclease